MTTPEPAPGTIGLVPMGGYGGRLIRAGQALNGDGFADFEHAFVYLGDAKVGNITRGIIEAEPGGSRITPLHHDGIHWCTGIYQLLRDTHPGTWALNLPADVLKEARKLTGIPYSWLDYAALTAHRLRIPAPGLRGYIASTGHMICSQLADELYRRLGAQIFKDGRWPGYVTPGALYQRDLQLRSTP